MRVYIDGENCRKGLARVLEAAGVISGSRQMKSYSLRGLLSDVLEREDLDIMYYVSKIKLPNGYEMSADLKAHVGTIRGYSRHWVPQLEAQQIKYVKAGYLKVKTTKECRNCGETQDVLQEKGVDVKIAADMIDAAYSNPDEAIVIMSSDSDLIPALNMVKNKGVHVIYVCFADWVNRAVNGAASETVSISTEKVKKYYGSADVLEETDQGVSENQTELEVEA